MTKNEQEIIKLRQNNKSYSEIKKILNLSKSTISYYCSKNNLNNKIIKNHLNLNNIINFREIHSITETLIYFNISKYFYYKHINKNINKSLKSNNKKIYYCLNCNNIYEPTHNKQKFCCSHCVQEFKFNLKINDWLNGNNNGVRGKNATCKWIKKYLIKLYGEKCMKCGWCEKNPYTENIPIELEHIDGNFKNNNIKNLILLCPNCHSLTSTYKSLNKGKGRPR